MIEDDCATGAQETTNRLTNDAHIAETSCRLETSRARRNEHECAANAAVHGSTRMTIDRSKRVRGMGRASGAQGPAPTTLQGATHGPPGPPRHIGGEGERVVPGSLDPHHAPRDQRDGDPAP